MSRPARPIGVASSTDQMTSADIGQLRRATGLAFAATTRIRRATVQSEQMVAAPSAGPAGEVIRRRVDIDYPTFANEPARVALNDWEKHRAYVMYVRDELNATVEAFAGLAAYEVEAVRLWGNTTRVELLKLQPKNGAVPTADELQAWRTDYLDALVAMVKDLDASGARAAANQNGDGGDERGDDGGDDDEDGWSNQAGVYVKAEGDALVDFRLLVAALDPGSIYKDSTGSIVGGYKGKRVDGLNDPSARIDAQMSPGKNLYNVQYQADNASYGGVLFALDDEEAAVIAALGEGVRGKTTRVSASYNSKRGAPKKKVVLSKKEKSKIAMNNRSKK